MEYMVSAPDGKEYGPASLDQLREWVRDDRVRPGSLMREVDGGRQIMASAIPGLFSMAGPPPPGAADWSQPPVAYPRSGPNVSPDDGRGVLIGVLLRSGAGVLFFFLLHGIGLIFCGYSLFYAIQSMGRGHRYGPISLAVAGVAFVAVLVGWVLRISHGGSM